MEETARTKNLYRAWGKKTAFLLTDDETAFVGRIARNKLRRPVTGEWGICISPSGTLLCVFPPALGG